MKNILLLPILLLLVTGCNLRNNRSESPFLKYAANKDGLIENYKYNENKPKVVTYVNGLKYFKGQLDYIFHRDRFQNFINKNSDFEFVFYARIDESQIDSALLMLKHYDISQIYYFDTEDACISKSGRMVHSSVVFDKNDIRYGGGILGAAFIKQIEHYMNILRKHINKDVSDHN